MKKVIVAVVLLAVTIPTYLVYKSRVDREEKNLLTQEAKTKISTSVFSKNKLPEAVKLSDSSDYSVKYTIDKPLQKYIRKLLKRYKSDYSSVVVVDNNNGNVLGALGYTKKTDLYDFGLPFSSTHPSASLIKIVTAAELMERVGIEPESTFRYRGRGSTLYKYQLDNKVTKWTRSISLARAFAFSNNVVFGKAAINHLSPVGIFKMAENFGFNQDLLPFLNEGKSIFQMPSDQYNLAEIASGFNNETNMSPLHGALLSLVVANEGKIFRPSFVQQVKDQASGEILYDKFPESSKVMSKDTASSLKKMMRRVVKSGTARGSFRRFKRKLRSSLVIGGKTGSLTGGLPYGKRDWFTAFAMPGKSEKDLGISICVMNVNVKKWYVRSAFLAKKVIEYFYKERYKSGDIRVAVRQ